MSEKYLFLAEDERKRKGEELDEEHAPESTHGWWCLSKPVKSKIYIPSPPQESIKSISQSFSTQVI